MRFVKNFACVFLKDISSIVIGDLHIGFEIELIKQGINVALMDKIITDLEVCKKKTKAENIILLGDVKHSIGFPKSRLEIKNLIKIFDFLKDSFEKIYVVKGNHDGRLEEIIKDERIKIYSSRGFSLSKYGFFHGNSYPIKNVISSRILFCSHVHSKYFLPKDKRIFEVRVYLIFKIKKEINRSGKIVVIPPFSSIISGKDVEECINESIINNIVENSSIEILTIDGIKI
ncbi:MAG: metallophosphoesterase [Candidatus Aenigmatarchaeota archaeon]